MLRERVTAESIWSVKAHREKAMLDNYREDRVLENTETYSGLYIIKSNLNLEIQHSFVMKK